MPLITATPVPAAGLIQVDVNWSENPTVAFARLERVNVATGEVQTVRPHTALNTALGQFMRLSAGRGRWFDTDAPFDTPVTYRLYGDDFPTEPWYGAQTSAFVRDAFGRTVAAGATWGTPDTGPAYTAFFTTTEASVAAGEGTLSMAAKNVLRGQRIAGGVTRTDWDVRFRVGVDVMPLTDHPLVWTYLRLDAAVDNYIALGVQFRTAGSIGYQVSKEVAGVASVVDSGISTLGYDISNGVEVRAQAIGTTARLKLWAQAGTEPEAWTSEVSIIDVPALGQAAVVGFVPTANTNVLPYVFDVDNLSAAGSSEATSAQVILASQGHAWLRDPLRPCNSLRLESCVDVSMCGDVNDGFEVGSAAGWTTDNATLTAEQAPTVGGSYRGKLTVDYTAGQAFSTDTPWPITLYNWTVDAQGWVGEGGTTSVARVTVPTPHDGSGMLQATKTGMGAGTETIRFNDAQGLRNLAANGPTLAVWAMVPLSTAGTNWVAHLEVQDPAFAWVAGADVPLVKGQWRLLFFTPPAGLLTSCRAIGMSFAGTGVSGSGVVFIDTLRQGAAPAAQLSRRLPVTPGTWVRASGWLMAPIDGTQARLAVNWITTGGSWINYSAGSPITLVGGNWTYVEALVEAPASSATAELTWTTIGSPATGTIIYGDDFSFEYRAPKEGAFFVSMDTESRAANSESVQPVNRRLAITASRPRRGVESTLTLATARFTDRDNLINITLPGSPLLFSAPVEYGIPQKYWDIGTTDVQRGMPDHRFQPRVHVLPIGEREAPAGPGKAPCGVSYDDGCDTAGLTTWAEVQAAGMTWLDLTDVS
jgi:hypothetical protein